jgi:phosphohistidine phosphatase
VIVLVHHADAVGADIDPQRPLSAGGRGDADRLAADVATRGAKPDVIWHSGKLRARQTAEAFLHACNPLAEFSAIRGLQPTDPPDWIRHRLVGDTRQIMLVGHMPSLPRILHTLIHGSTEGSDEFPLHGAVALETYDERWRVVWIAQ